MVHDYISKGLSRLFSERYLITGSKPDPSPCMWVVNIFGQGHKNKKGIFHKSVPVDI